MNDIHVQNTLMAKEKSKSKIIAEKDVYNSREHIGLLGFDRFVSLWTEHYSKLRDEQKNMLPLHAVYFLGSNE